MKVTQIVDEYKDTLFIINLSIGKVRKQLKEANYKYNKHYDCYYLKSHRTDWNYLVPEDYIKLIPHAVEKAHLLNKFIKSEVAQ